MARRRLAADIQRHPPFRTLASSPSRLLRNRPDLGSPRPRCFVQRIHPRSAPRPSAPEHPHLENATPQPTPSSRPRQHLRRRSPMGIGYPPRPAKPKPRPLRNPAPSNQRSAQPISEVRRHHAARLSHPRCQHRQLPKEAPMLRPSRPSLPPMPNPSPQASHRRPHHHLVPPLPEVKLSFD